MASPIPEPGNTVLRVSSAQFISCSTTGRLFSSRSAPIGAVGEDHGWRVGVISMTDEHFKAATLVVHVGGVNMAGEAARACQRGCDACGLCPSCRPRIRGSPFFRGLRLLRGDDPGSGYRPAARSFSRLRTKLLTEVLENSCHPPAAEGRIDRIGRNDILNPPPRDIVGKDLLADLDGDGSRHGAFPRA